MRIPEEKETRKPEDYSIRRLETIIRPENLQILISDKKTFRHKTRIPKGKKIIICEHWKFKRPKALENQAVKKPENHKTTRSKDHSNQKTRRPRYRKINRSEYQGSRTPEDQKARTTQNQKTWRPDDWKTRGSEDQTRKNKDQSTRRPSEVYKIRKPED